MSKEKIKTKLIRYQMKFEESGKSLNIKLGLSLEILIAFNDDNKISIIDRLSGWNPLSGFFKMSLKNAMIFNTISIVVFWILFMFIFNSLKLYIGFEVFTMSLVCIWGYVLYWSTYYQIKAESFKRTLMNWLDE